MSIFKRGNSPNFYVSFKDPSTGEFVEKSTRTPKRHEALREAERIEKEWGGRLVELPLFSLAEEYLAEMEALGRAKEQRKAHKTEVGVFLKWLYGEGEVGDKKGEVSPATLTAFLRHLATSGKAPGTVISYRDALRAFCSFLIRQGLLTINPVTGIKVARCVKVRPKRAFSPDEYPRFISSCPSPRRAAIYRIAALSGLRRSEMKKVRAQDYNLPKGLWTLRGEIQKVKGKAITLPLLTGLVGLLGAFPPPWVVPTIKTFDNDLDAAGLEKRDEAGRSLTFHSLRYSFITFLARAGVPIQDVQKLARHRRIEETVGTYLDLGLGDLVATVKGLPDLKL